MFSYTVMSEVYISVILFFSRICLHDVNLRNNAQMMFDWGSQEFPSTTVSAHEKHRA